MSGCMQPHTKIKRICRKNVRCVLEYEKGLYLILGGLQDEDLIIKAKWNPYNGFVHVDEDVPEDLIAFADQIVERHSSAPERYSLKGEWYSVKACAEDGQTRWKLKKIKKASSTTRIACLSFLLPFLLAMAFGLFLSLWYADFVEEWLSAVLTGLDPSAISPTAIAIQIIGCTALFLLFKERRDWLDLYLNAVVPFGLMVSAGLLKCYWWMWLVIPLGFVVAFLIGMVLIVVLEECEKKWYRCIGEYVRLASIILMVILMLVIGLGGLSPHVDTSEPPYSSNLTTEELKEQYYDACYLLEKEKWDALGQQERLDVLQTICDYECQVNLGCELVRVKVGDTVHETSWGEYTDTTRSFVIRTDHLMNNDVEYVVRTALHETRHAYQHSLVEMYASVKPYIAEEHKNLSPLREIEAFADNIENYHLFEGDEEEYFKQALERDSRDWSEKRLKEYYLGFIYPDR